MKNPAITAGWAIVAVSLVWFTWDTYRMVREMQYQDIPAWQHTLVGYVVATLFAFGIAALTALTRGRWAGIILIIASLALGAVPVVTALALAACHGCSGRGGLGTTVIFLVYTPIAIVSLRAGIRQSFGADEAVHG